MSPSSKNNFTINFRGVRGSYPASGKDYLKYGGNTTCFEINAGSCKIIVDAGTGIVSLGDDMLKDYLSSGKDINTREPLEAIILFTHVHLDHVQGLPFFTPIHMPQNTFYMYGPDISGYSFEDSLSGSVKAPVFPISFSDLKSLKLLRSYLDTESIFWGPNKGIPAVVNNFRDLKRLNDSVKKNPIRITALKSYAHPKDGVYIYKIEFDNKSVVIATDTEGYRGNDAKLVSFAKDADLLIHDASYTSDSYENFIGCKQGFGHSTPEMAAELAIAANVKQLALVHHEPNYSDSIIDGIEKTAQNIFKNSYAAKEHQIFSL